MSTIVVAEEMSSNTQYIIDLPTYDSAYNSNFDVRNPSMAQALQLSKAFYQFSHDQLQSFWGKNSDAGLLSIILFDSVATWLPLSNAWLHEEWHRAVMGQHGISSRNDIYDLQLFTETISVSQVSDADLIALKKNHVSDIIRLHAVGLESQNQFNLSLEFDQFYEETQSYDNILIWFNTINSTAYLSACSTEEANKITTKILSHEGQDISDRDFTGLDCNAWVYDLFRPFEAYEDRGFHPSGNGINRYITYEKLGSAERSFLRRQFYLSFLNFVDPFLLNKVFFNYQNNIDKTNVVWNANIKHYLTPFGYSIHLNTFLKIDNKNYFVSLKNYFNQNSYFPGIDISFINQPFHLLNQRFNITTKIELWKQPQEFSFTTRSAKNGGSLSSKVEHYLTHQLSSYFLFSHKTTGWQAGNVYLGSNTSIVFGLRYRHLAL